MEKIQLKELFDKQYKFQLNQQVRHKADHKGGDFGSSDMGLLILARVMQEEEDPDGNVFYERAYHCRSIKFSGSGEIIRFRENELMSMEDFLRQEVENKEWRNRMHEEMKIVQNEIFTSFGVKRGSQIALIKDGKADKDDPYRITGFESGGDTGVLLHANRILGCEKKPDSVKLRSKSEFEIITE